MLTVVHLLGFAQQPRMGAHAAPAPARAAAAAPAGTAAAPGWWCGLHPAAVDLAADFDTAAAASPEQRRPTQNCPAVSSKGHGP